MPKEKDRTRRPELCASLQGLVRGRDCGCAVDAIASVPTDQACGLASGNVEASWKDAIRNTEARFVSDVVPPAHSANAQYPLTAHAQGIYRAGPGELELAELTASTRATQIRASGTLSTSAALKLSVHDHRSWRMATRYSPRRDMPARSRLR